MNANNGNFLSSMGHSVWNSTIVTSFRSLKGNARHVILFYPLFSVPFAMSNIFFGVYMRELGITSAQMGYLMTIMFVSTIVMSFFSNTIIDKIGRKRFSLIADGLILPLMLVTRLAANTFWLFAIASVISGCMALSGMATNFMLTEDTPPEKRIYAFNAFSMVMMGSGIFSVFSADIIRWLGIGLAEKLMLGATAAGMIVMAVARNHFVKETDIGKQAMDSNNQGSGRISLGITKQTLQTVVADKQLALALFIVVAFMTYTFIGSYTMSQFYTLYLIEVLQFSQNQAARFALILVAAQLATAIFIIPNIAKARPRRNILLGLVASLLSTAVLILAPVRGTALIVLGNILFAVGFGITKPSADTLLANAAQGPRRAAVYSLMGFLSNSLAALGSFAAGQIYNFKPALLFVFAASFVVLILVVLISGFISRNLKKRFARASFYEGPDTAGNDSEPKLVAQPDESSPV
jgi:MFS transporter, DHA1 family, tetracycline resistance protein